MIDKTLVKENERLLYNIEKFRNMDTVERYAKENGFVPLRPRDFNVITVKERNGR